MLSLKNLILNSSFLILQVWYVKINYVNLLAILLILAAVGKSAQLGFHV
jgi:NADH:ubiquinone oxidoreductase subunit 5 (subunit L)/multisubunit Na+/H+ antiporter MnhA subunit